MSQTVMNPPRARQGSANDRKPEGKRDTSKDGFKNKAELFVLTHGGPLWRALQKSPLEGPFNHLLINSGVDKVEPRPYRLSTKSDYTSWDTLTDRAFHTRSLPPAAQDDLPDISEVARLFAREQEIPCEKSTVLFAYVAQWFTDGFLRSERGREADGLRNITKNESTHEVDLAQLYGVRPETTAALRTPPQNGDGLLKSQVVDGEEFPPFLCRKQQQPDGSTKHVIKDEFMVFEDGSPPRPAHGLEPLRFNAAGVTDAQRERMFAMGSDSSNLQIGYAMLNVLFLREHNRIVRELDKAYPKGARGWSADPVERSDRLFGTARNILTVMLIKVVIEEYINHIAPYHFQFRFDPSPFHKEQWIRPNWVAVEFNLLYRWHSLIPSALDVGDDALELKDTTLQMQLLLDHGLGRLFENASGQHAGRVGLHNTDAWLLPQTEVPSIGECRKVRLARYNSYREYCKFPKVQRFEQITKDVTVREELRELYDGDVDNIEFYVGLFAEDRRPNSVLPSMVGRLVGLHAFSQLMTNPLVAPAVYKDDATFTQAGRRIIDGTKNLKQLLNRNLPEGSREFDAHLTHHDWVRS